MADVQILCELRADKGEAWFDTSSIGLTRIATPKKAAPKPQQTAGRSTAPAGATSLVEHLVPAP